MTNDAQNALRRIMEKFTENVRFCLIGNYLSKIIPALQSRSFKPFLCIKKLEQKMFLRASYISKTICTSLEENDYVKKCWGTVTFW
jgi:hypothetical protein